MPSWDLEGHRLERSHVTHNLANWLRNMWFAKGSSVMVGWDQECRHIDLVGGGRWGGDPGVTDLSPSRKLGVILGAVPASAREIHVGGLERLPPRWNHPYALIRHHTDKLEDDASFLLQDWCYLSCNMPRVFGESFLPLMCLLNNKIRVLGLCSGLWSLLTYKLHCFTHHLCAGTFQICTLNSDCFPKLQTLVPTCVTHRHLSSIVGRERKRRKGEEREKRGERMERLSVFVVYILPLLFLKSC